MSISSEAITDDPYELAQVAVTHALSEYIYAMGGQPVTALAMVTVPYGKPPVIQSLLQQLLAGAKCQLDEDNVALVGGHTTEGAELTIGFSVNGIVDENQVLRKSGMQQDQAIILTKALGTGTLFAADMQYKASGMWIDQALRSMKRSNLEASQILKGIPCECLYRCHRLWSCGTPPGNDGCIPLWCLPGPGQTAGS